MAIEANQGSGLAVIEVNIKANVIAATTGVDPAGDAIGPLEFFPPCPDQIRATH